MWLFGQGVLVHDSDPQPLQCLLGRVVQLKKRGIKENDFF
jgi:hypothetical protein